ncbi:MAG: Mur ligase family protein [Alphaproteobacteria bacterium]
MILKDKIKKYIFNSSNKIKINSKDIKKNDIFLALKGSNYHGNKYINDAINAGAKYCITDKDLKRSNGSKEILLVENIQEFLIDLSEKKRSSYNGQVVGITGSAGKTSLKECLKFFLGKKFNVSASIKSYNNNLGIMISILNMNLKSDYAIFEIGTNNFFEIRKLSKLVKPSQIFITNILSTHLENFKNKRNIAIEKSDIFKKIYNPLAEILIFQKKSKEEQLIYNIAKKEKLKKLIQIGTKKDGCYIAKVKKMQSKYEISLIIFNKNYKIYLSEYEEKTISNLLFVLIFFILNKINTNIIINNNYRIPKVDGRGSIHNFILNKFKVKLIDQSYNANPETMVESIKNFSIIKNDQRDKFLILGNMNELGLKSHALHIKVIKEIEKYQFHEVILSGDFFKKALSMFSKLKNNYVYKNNSQNIMSYLKKNLHKNAIIMAKCSNKTEVNKFVKLIRLKKKG